MTPLRPAAAALVALTVFALAACVPSDPTPRPTGTSTSSAAPTESESASPTPSSDEAAGAAIVVVTASGIAVFGTDGATLANVTYVMDAAAVAADLAEALGEDPTVYPLDAVGESCPARTMYNFGGLLIGSPAAIGSAGFLGSGDRYDAFVSQATTTSGVAIETVAGQHIGSARSAFEAAVGDEVLLDDYEGASSYGFDIVNPEAGPYDHVGVQAWFGESGMTGWLAPAAIGFIGDCG